MGDTQTASAEAKPQSPTSELDLYRTFDSFPWSKTLPFLVSPLAPWYSPAQLTSPPQGALIDTLGGAQNLEPKATHVGTSIFCRSVFYHRQTGIQVDATKYITFVSGHASYPSVDERLVRTLYETRASVEGELAASTNATLRLAKAIAALPQIDPFEGFDGNLDGLNGPAAPEWQNAAPVAELRVKRGPEEAPSASIGTGDAPSSEKFAAVAAAIQSGQPLEGVRQIPDTVEQPPVCFPTSC